MAQTILKIKDWILERRWIWEETREESYEKEENWRRNSSSCVC